MTSSLAPAPYFIIIFVLTRHFSFFCLFCFVNLYFIFGPSDVVRPKYTWKIDTRLWTPIEVRPCNVQLEISDQDKLHWLWSYSILIIPTFSLSQSFVWEEPRHVGRNGRDSRGTKRKLSQSFERYHPSILASYGKSWNFRCCQVFDETVNRLGKIEITFSRRENSCFLKSQISNLRSKSPKMMKRKIYIKTGDKTAKQF